MHGQSLTFLALLACILLILVAMCSSAPAAVELLELHGADGQVVFVNTAEISSLRAPTQSDLQHYFPQRVACVVVTTNGKFIAAREPCPAIRDRLSGHPTP